MHVPGKEVHQYVPDALSRLCENIMPPKAAVASSSLGILAVMESTFHIPDAIFRVIAKVHNSAVGHHGLQMCKKRLKAQGYNFTDRMITQFIRQCPCCQVMNRLRIPIRTHPFTCASYNPFEVYIWITLVPSKPMIKGIRIYSSSLTLSPDGWSSSPQRVFVPMRQLLVCFNISVDSALLHQYIRIEGLLSTTS